MVREASQRDRRQPPGMAAPATTARANVNLALVKYWGKRDRALNLPATGSISLTLDGLSVEASVAFGGGEADRVEIDGVEAAGDEALRVARFLDLVRAEAGRRDRALVTTRSTVPRGVGLASSAAAFAALALAASASAAKAAAEDASPTPRGTVLRVATCARSRRPASARTTSRKRATRTASSPPASTPSISTRSASAPPKATDASTERPSSVSEMLPVAGRLSARSRFPQYFTSARFTLARAVVAGAAIPAGCVLSLWLGTRTIGCLTDDSRPIGQATAQENPRDPEKPSGPAGIRA